jgi:uncharacterized membrane protein
MHDIAQQIFLWLVVALFATFMITLMIVSLRVTFSEQPTKAPEREVTPARRTDEVVGH